MSVTTGIRHIRTAVFVFCAAFMLITQALPAQCGEKEQTEYHDITVRMEEQGHLPSSRDRGGIKYYYYLDMVVRLEGAEPDTEYTIDFSKAEYTYTNPYEYDAKTNPVSVTTDKNGSAEISFALKHGQEFTICDLPEGTSYAVSEESNGRRMDDKKEIKNEENIPFVPDIRIEQVPGYEDSKEGKLNGKDVRVSFLNIRTYRIPVPNAYFMFPVMTPFLIAAFIVVVMITVREHLAKKKHDSGSSEDFDSDTERSGQL